MKSVVFLGDGMADEPVPALDGKTPLEAANHPAMDCMAAYGRLGLTRTVPRGMLPGSDTANLSIFGYDPEVYYTGRSPLEAVSMGISLRPEDVTCRCNLLTVSEAPTLAEAVMVDYSAGGVTSPESAQLVDFLKGELLGPGQELYPGLGYRQCLVLRNAPDGTELTPPHNIVGRRVGEYLPQGGGNAEFLLKFMERSYALLKDHPVNQRRVEKGLPPANCAWFWGEGRVPVLPPMREMFGIRRGAVISAMDLVQGIGLCAGLTKLTVPGATGTLHTDFAAKGRAAIDAFEDGNELVYIHVEATDECSHYGQVREKIWSIEQIDEKIVAPVLAYLRDSGEPWAALVMPDHPTPLEKRVHTEDPVPFALLRSDSLRESAPPPRRFTEAAGRATGVFLKKATGLMPELLRK